LDFTQTPSAEAVRFAFEFFMAAVKLLGQRWIAKHGAVPSLEWQRLLAPFAHLNPEQCAGKLVASLKPNDRGEVWPPEIADVVHMLRPKPEDHGMPPADRAFRAATQHRWIHPAVYEAAFRVGVFELRHGQAKRDDFDPVYAAVCEEAITGNTKRWQKRTTEAADLLAHERKPWVGKPEEAKLRCDMLRRCIGPIETPPKPEPVKPVNDEEFQQLQREQLDALADAAARYQGAQ
jgi:hypothetical protein